MSYELQFLQSLALTIGTELAAAILLRKFAARWFFPESGRAPAKDAGWPRFITAVFLASTLTLPYVWFLFPALIKSRIIFIVVSELWAWWMEALFYRYFLNASFKQMIVLSGVVNAFSFGIGLLLVN